MLVIRLQRTGRKGHASFRVVVQNSRQTPTSSKVVELLGSYDPHTKAMTIKQDRAAFYLEHGAQPSERVAKLLKEAGVKLPKWLETAAKKTAITRHPEKLRKNRPAEEVAAEPEEVPAAKPEVVEPPAEEPAEAAAPKAE